MTYRTKPLEELVLATAISVCFAIVVLCSLGAFAVYYDGYSQAILISLALTGCIGAVGFLTLYLLVYVLIE
ncbi:hypothetical protein IQ22_00665 [Pseudomonas duriflava]|uniref:Uncharacterized protein n=1 Tax=Pseudomonas duriflava TaxID=459528 RepID=A0A562QL57_9PSED|nr:hypothetical protein [Pseudomonas duriflava]TWI57449.1 hypothetical protein IQ22_00665 [Pseudomonas duriflava]